MSETTAGQAACIAWNAHYAEQHAIEARNEWAASDQHGREAWEAAARAAVAAYIEANGRDPVDVVSVIAEVIAPDLARLRDGITALLANITASADATRPSKKTALEDEFAIGLRKLLEAS